MIYQIACFEINTLSKQLSIHNKVVKADQRLPDLFIELVNHYPNHCSKSALIETLWPDTVVSDWSISKLVSEARQLFKQYGYQQEVIQTLHGRGYRLASDLGDQIVKIEAQPVQTKIKHTPALPFMMSTQGKWTLFAGLMLICGVAWLLVSNQPQPLQKSEPVDSIGRLLWVDDNPHNNLTEKRYLEKQNITVYQVNSTEEALTSLELYEFDVIISDMGRDGEVLAGLNLLKSLREKNNHTPFLFYTIVLTQTQQNIIEQYQGQGVAVEAQKLYQLVLPFFENEPKTAATFNISG
ncbi:response regulator [Paraglaciecola arctica]|uniref:response regulator n=1 Tax=Paraglaciecola arctica TaxID=1128911 RepID=UPI001C075BD4|nr:response regulator [Paraglaciecola arctica]MBU3002143.1 response regulator [Paraglaciecola arctica]